MDGLGVVYGRLGEPLMAEGERLTAQRTATAFALFEGKRARGQPVIHHGQGEVVLHLTDLRMLVLVDPSLSTARRVLHLPGDESWTRGMELFEVIQGRGRYYLEVPWSEVPRVRLPSARRESATLAIRPSGDGPMTLLVDRETAAWIAKAQREAHEGQR